MERHLIFNINLLRHNNVIIIIYLRCRYKIEGREKTITAIPLNIGERKR